MFGAVLTLIIYAIVLIYAQMKGQKLYFKQETFHQTILNKDEILQEDKFTLKELEANFALSLWANNFSTPLNLSLIDDYVHFEAQLANYYYDDGKYELKV